MELLEPYETNSEGNISNQSTKYLICQVGTPLTKALCEIVQKQPLDPIEYLSGWLYKYKENQLQIKRENEHLKIMIEAEIQRIKKMACMEEEKRLVMGRRKQLLEIRRQEILKKQEEARKKIEMEKIRLRNLCSQEKKDKNGQTSLHCMAAEPDADFTKLNNIPQLLVERDKNNRTPRDVAEQMGLKENVAEIDKYVWSLLKKGDTTVLKYLLLNSYEHFQPALDLQLKPRHLPETTKIFLSTLKVIQEKITDIFSSVQEGDNESVEKLLGMQPLLATSKNKYSHSILHVAILFNNIPAVKLLLETNPDIVNTTDNFNRTPLHFAYALSAPISEILLENKANDSIEDIRNKIPIYYNANPSEILNIKVYYMKN